MTDRKKIEEIFSELRNFADNDVHPVVSPENWHVYSQLHDLIDRAEEDAFVLLKEQEAVEPKEIVNELFPIGDYRRTIGWLCGKCGKAIMGNGKYCSYCGTKVKWV